MSCLATRPKPSGFAWQAARHFHLQQRDPRLHPEANSPALLLPAYPPPPLPPPAVH